MKYFIFTLSVLFLLNTKFANAAILSNYQIEFTDKDVMVVRKNGKVIASESLNNIDKVYTEFDLIDVTGIKGLSKEEIETVNLLNLEAKWIKGKRTLRIPSVSGGLIEIPISFADHVEILRYKTSIKNSFPLPRMTSIERERYDKLAKQIKNKIDENAEALLKIKKRKDLNPEEIKQSQHLDKAISASIQKSAELFILILDGLPYAVDTTSGNAAVIEKSVCPVCNPNNHNLEFKIDITGSINCSGLSTTPTDTPYMRIKLNQFYGVINPQINSSYDIENSLFFVDTSQGNALCVQNASDRIFASSFEQGEQ